MHAFFAKLCAYVNMQEPDDAAEADIATIPPWSALESENSPENELIKKLLIVAVQSHWIRLYRRGRVKRSSI